MRKKYRLRANADFQHIRRQGRTLLHPLMVISTLPNGLEHSRFGFAVGRRIGKAAKRNQIKRRMRESVRVRILNREIVAGWDVVFVARSPIRDAPYHVVDEAIGHLLRQARLVSGTS
jgi:ribonuclease P protein component